VAAYRRVYDSQYLQADCMPRNGISSGTLRSVIEYGLPFTSRRLVCDDAGESEYLTKNRKGYKEMKVSVCLDNLQPRQNEE